MELFFMTEYPAAWPRWARRLIATCDTISGAAAWLAGTLLLALAALVVGLVLIRALSGWQHNGAEELKWHLFGAMTMLGGAWCLRHDGHVRVDVLISRVPPRLRAAIEALTLTACLSTWCAVMIAYGIDTSAAKLAAGEASNQAGGLGQRWVIWATIPLGFALLAIQGLAAVTRRLLIAWRGPALAEAPEALPEGV
ncbi:MAG: TRAP transporter small permease subunit [Planctomycetota bacterium]|jgi:TRAP-type mannitol/chloroaromatic compound transport system permease small subunit